MKKKIAFLLVMVLSVIVLLCACGAKKPTAILFKENAVEIKIEEQYQLEYTIIPEDAEASELKWQSANVDVVTVDESGNLTGIAPGTATVVLSTPDGVMASCEVTVLPPTAYELLNEYEKTFVDSIGTMIVETRGIAQIDNDYTYSIGVVHEADYNKFRNISNINVGVMYEPKGEKQYEKEFRVIFFLIDKNAGLADDSLICSYYHNFEENRGYLSVDENTASNYLNFFGGSNYESEIFNSEKINAALDEFWSN